MITNCPHCSSQRWKVSTAQRVDFPRGYFLAECYECNSFLGVISVGALIDKHPGLLSSLDEPEMVTSSRLEHAY
jgi:hypothetical protein